MLAILAAIAILPGTPTLGIETLVLMEKSPSAAASALQSRFKSQIEQRKWESAFETAGEYIETQKLDPYLHMQRDWYRYELLLLANKLDKVIKHTESSLRPLGVYQDKPIRRPKDYMELVAKVGASDELKEMNERYTHWSVSHSKALEFVELASTMTGDFKRATWAVDELSVIPTLCGTGMEAVQFQFHARKLVYERSQKDRKLLRKYADKGFVPIKWPSTDLQRQVHFVAVYARWAEAGLAPSKEKRRAFERLKDILDEQTAVNEQRLFLRIATERLAAPSG